MKGGHSFQSYSFWIQSINTTTSTTTTMNWLHGVTPISLQLDNVLLDIFIVLINKQLLDEVEHDSSWCHSKTEFNNCFIIHFSRNSWSETEAKRSAILFLRRTLQGA